MEGPRKTPTQFAIVERLQYCESGHPCVCVCVDVCDIHSTLIIVTCMNTCDVTRMLTNYY